MLGGSRASAIRTILTDNGRELTDRLFGTRKCAPAISKEFDNLCAELGLEQRLALPKSPQTNRIVERFNGQIEELLQSHHFQSGQELETTLRAMSGFTINSPSISPKRHVAIASDEGLAQTAAEAVQYAALSSGGMCHLTPIMFRPYGKSKSCN